jgi:hypothetical protein
MHASHVVVDESDGYMFWRDHDGELFTEETARRFADLRNSDRMPQHRRYVVYRVTDPAAETAEAKIIDLLNEYGSAKFGDEWWPGNSEAWIGEEAGETPRNPPGNDEPSLKGPVSWSITPAMTNETRRKQMPEYEVTERCVEVLAALTEPQFRRIGVILGEPLGRFKGWSEHFTFGPDSDAKSAELCAYLRSLPVPHTEEVTRRWPPDDPDAPPPPG